MDYANHMQNAIPYTDVKMTTTQETIFVFKDTRGWKNSSFMIFKPITERPLRSIPTG